MIIGGDKLAVVDGDELAVNSIDIRENMHN